MAIDHLGKDHPWVKEAEQHRLERLEGAIKDVSNIISKLTYIGSRYTKGKLINEN